MTDAMKKEIIDDILDSLGSHVVSIILYGSVARGDNTSESDIDIAIITDIEINHADMKRLCSRTSAIDLKYDCFLSLVDIAVERFNNWKRTLPFYQNILNEGIVLWNAA